MAEYVGRVLAGRYHLIEVAGRDRLGTIVNARDTQNSRAILVRMFDQYAKPTPEGVERAARVAAPLHSPFILPVTGFGGSPFGAWIAHAKPQGPSLAAYRQRIGRIDPRDAGWIGKRIAAALEIAHAAGVAHGALSPGAVWVVQEEGVPGVRVGDFALHDSIGAIVHDLLAHFTAPEVTQPGDVRPEADLYALGVVLFQAVAGRPPFRGRDAAEIRALARKEAAPVLPDTVPRLLREIITALLEKDPEDRPSAAAVALRLGVWLDELGWQGPELGGPGRVEGDAASSPEFDVDEDDYEEEDEDKFEVDWSHDEAEAAKLARGLKPPPTAAPAVPTAKAHSDEARPKSSSAIVTGIVLMVLVAAVGVFEWQTGKIREVLGLSVPQPGAAVEPAAKPAPAATVTVSTVPAADDAHRWVRIEGGQLVRGVDEGVSDEIPRHSVKISRPFEIGATEVTRAQWGALIDVTPAAAEECGDDCPVEFVTFWEALHYANALSRSEAKPECYVLDGCEGTPGGLMTCEKVRFTGLLCRGYRLPTEAEWELAASRGARVGRQKRIHPVTTSPASGGIYGLLGNVGEWVWDRYDPKWYSYGTTADPIGPMGGDRRVVRGCSFRDETDRCRVGARFFANPDEASHAIGFRLARTLDL